MKKRLYFVTALILISIGGWISSSMAGGVVVPKADYTLRPMIFVHGGSGSGAQFWSQAMRFTSNFYPAEYIFALEYDSTFTLNTMNDVYAALDAKIAAIQAATGFDQVDVLGHSLGTTVMHGYLAFPDRAANVAHYVNIDGRTALTPPGGVSTLAIWAGTGTPGRAIVGAINVTVPNQTHVQSATSAESFVEMYRFFTGKEPMTSYIIPDPPGQVRLAGRVAYFPYNVGLPNTTLEIWKVDAATGARTNKKPMAICALDSDGYFGPIKAHGGESYEFAVVQQLLEGTFTHHFYFEPFIRSDYLIRLPTSPRGQGVSAYMDTSENQTNAIVQRYKEFWGNKGAENDAILVNGVDVVNAATCPINKRVIAMFLFDNNVDGISDLSTMLFPFNLLSFLSGVDLYIPANPPDDTVQFMVIPRGDASHTQMINVPNWASSEHTVSIMFNDYTQDIKSFPDWAKSHGQ